MNDYINNAGNQREDLALSTLFEIAQEGEMQLSNDLIRELYLLQKRHQFDSDRAASVQEMQRLLEKYVDAPIEGVG
jgi:hypothetical protein